MTKYNGVDALTLQLALPSQQLIADMSSLDGDIVVIGAGGKIGPNLIRLLLNADRLSNRNRRIFAVSRFSRPDRLKELQEQPVSVIPFDVATQRCVGALPEAKNVIYLVGARFGTAGAESAMWHTNILAPTRILERYQGSRIVFLSTGNVYPQVDFGANWPNESSKLEPVGEYAFSCLGRERVISHLAEDLGVNLSIIRLNYSVELRYGPIIDIAQSLLREEAIDLTVGYLSVIWQNYSNSVILRSLLKASSPPFVLNVAGPELVSVREVALELGRLLDKPVRFSGIESSRAVLSDASKCYEIFGKPEVSLAQIINMTADWIKNGFPLFGVSTGFQQTGGVYR